MEEQTQSQNPADKKQSFLHEFAGILKESLCWDELIVICLSCYPLHVLVSWSLSMIRLLLVLYFLLSVICSLLRDSLQISPTGWKERSIFAKLACVAKAAYFSCFDISNMRRECSVIWEKAKELYASMSRNDELEDNMCSWEKEWTDLMKQQSEIREEIRGYMRRSSEMETIAMNLNKALESVEARERGCGERVDEVLGSENKLRVLFKESATQLLDESKLKIEDQQLQIVKLNENIEKLKIERYEHVAKLFVATCKVEALSIELKEVKAKFEDEIKALSTEHEAAKAKLEDEKNELNAKLQIANESVEFQQKLRQEYHFI